MPIDLSQYVRIPGSARRYRDKTTGEEISRWQYQIKQGGGDPRKLAKDRAENSDKRGAATRRYSTMVNNFKAKTAAKLGIDPKAVRVRGDSKEAKEFRKVTKEIIANNKKVSQIRNKLRTEGSLVKRNELEHELRRTELKTHRRLQKINFRPDNMSLDEYEKWKAQFK